MALTPTLFPSCDVGCKAIFKPAYFPSRSGPGALQWTEHDAHIKFDGREYVHVIGCTTSLSGRSTRKEDLPWYSVWAPRSLLLKNCTICSFCYFWTTPSALTKHSSTCTLSRLISRRTKGTTVLESLPQRKQRSLFGSQGVRGSG